MPAVHPGQEDVGLPPSRPVPEHPAPPSPLAAPPALPLVGGSPCTPLPTAHHTGLLAPPAPGTGAQPNTTISGGLLGWMGGGVVHQQQERRRLLGVASSRRQ